MLYSTKSIFSQLVDILKIEMPKECLLSLYTAIYVITFYNMIQNIKKKRAMIINWRADVVTSLRINDEQLGKNVHKHSYSCVYTIA